MTAFTWFYGFVKKLANLCTSKFSQKFLQTDFDSRIFSSFLHIASVACIYVYIVGILDRQANEDLCNEFSMRLATYM